jgi:hypothetical protein
MLKSCLNFLTSLRLTVVCLVLALLVVFIGTLAEVRMGLYDAQAEIFRSLFIHWTPPGWHMRIPVFPGGWLIGLVLLVNLLAAHIKRFQPNKKKTGILLIHSGLIFLLVGQLMTEMFQVESQMRLPVGATRNFTEDSRRHELALIDVTDPANDKVISIPEELVAQGGDIRPPGLPFTLRVKSYFQNSTPAGPMSGPGEKLKATQGIGRQLLFTALPEAKRMDDENRPTALVEVLAGDHSLGDWTVSYWLGKPALAQGLQSEFGAMMNIPLTEPQRFDVAGHTWQMALRPLRYPKPYSITLLEFKHDTYPGTDIPSNFSSKIHLRDLTRGEDRDVLIRMNAPLRYGGETFYQASFEEGDQVSILQVVRNPAALTPYVACSLIAAGLIVQFLTHLFAFARKQAQPPPAPPARGSPARVLQPALSGKRSNP